MKYIHVFVSDENNKFSKGFIKFIDENFGNEEHLFFLTERKDINIFYEQKNVQVLSYNLNGTINFIRKAKQCEKVLFHGLAENKFVILSLLLVPSLFKKSFWCVWGGDLYHYKYRFKSLKSNIIEIFRKHIIKNMHGIITQLRGDYELAQKWYGAKGKYYYSFMYPSNLYKEYDLKKVEKSPGKTYIQVGNSACETNKHIDVFDKLAKYKNENIEIICPLSYSGKEEYIKQVIDAGYKTFGKDKFSPLTEFLSFDRYLELLAKIDIAIFNHKRQRGLGNIITLLGLGKKVYIREEITTWQFCLDHGLKVYSADGEFEDLFDEMDEGVTQRNIENMKAKFSEEKLIEDWKRIFDGDGLNDKSY